MGQLELVVSWNFGERAPRRQQEMAGGWQVGRQHIDMCPMRLEMAMGTGLV